MINGTRTMKRLSAGLFVSLIILLFSASSPLAGRGKPVTLRVLTYNVYGYEKISESRVRSIMRTFIRSRADVIALQEVRPWLLKRMRGLAPLAGYHWSWKEKSGFSPGKVLLLSRHRLENVEYHRLPSPEDRYVCVADIRVKGRRVTVAALHLTSPMNFEKKRIEQLQVVQKKLAGRGPAVILGDFNFGEGSPEAGWIAGQGMKDLWKELKPGEPGYTWNMEENELSRKNAFVGEESRRLDRIYYDPAAFRPLSVELITGERPCAKNVPYASDHYAVQGLLEVLPAREGPASLREGKE